MLKVVLAELARHQTRGQTQRNTAAVAMVVTVAAVAAALAAHMAVLVAGRLTLVPVEQAAQVDAVVTAVSSFIIRGV